MPFTKRTLKHLCGKINREQSNYDATKTVQLLIEMKAADHEFSYSVQVDEESRIKTLMWTTGRGIHQYQCFAMLLHLTPPIA